VPAPLPALARNTGLGRLPRIRPHRKISGEDRVRPRVVPTRGKISPAKAGCFEGDLGRMAASVKDHELFPDGWAYLNFGEGGRLKDNATARPKASVLLLAQTARRGRQRLSPSPTQSSAPSRNAVLPPNRRNTNSLLCRLKPATFRSTCGQRMGRVARAEIARYSSQAMRGPPATLARPAELT
jgi:hypothetical protein